MAILNPIRIGPRPDTKSAKFSLVTSGCVTISFVFLISVPPPSLRWKHDTRKRLYCKVIYWLAYKWGTLISAGGLKWLVSHSSGLIRHIKEIPYCPEHERQL